MKGMDKLGGWRGGFGTGVLFSCPYELLRPLECCKVLCVKFCPPYSKESKWTTSNMRG